MLGTYNDGRRWTDAVFETLELDAATSTLMTCPAAKIAGGNRHFGAQFNLFAIESRIPTPPATTTGGWRARPGSTRELRTDGILVFDVVQNPSTGQAWSSIPFDQEAMWDWYSGGSDDQKAITNRTNIDWAGTDNAGTGARRARYRHSGDRCGALWGDMRVSATNINTTTRGNFRIAKNGRKQSWEPK
ncbi:MAG: hypothetical protein J0M02_03090 [Planctomycetes bacterium]|nr:hypothetical protein [Planctomycetota bacterium]